jgi:hypothetical protein
MASIVKIKRSSVQGRAPTTSNLDTGELALNIRDGKLFSANSSTVFEIGANVESSHVGTLTVGNTSPYTFPTSDGTSGQTLISDGNGNLTFGAGSGSITVQDEGSSLTSSATTLNFVGAGVTASGTGTTKTITINGGGGGGASLSVGNSAPSSPSEGDMWYDTDTGIINIYVGTAWVESTVNLYAGAFAGNSYVTSTFTTNSVFQSALANTNAYIANKTSYVTANTISVKNPDSYHVYAVTVASKTSAHPYTGTGSSSGYFLDGVEAPSIILAPNQTYRFDQSDASNSSHPLVFYTSATSGSYTTGVTSSGTPGSAGAYTEIVVDEDTPQVLYYMCSNHANMGSVASILSDTSPQYLQVANSTSFITSTALTPYLEVANLSSYGYATESYVDTEVAAIVNSAPTLLNTLDELANALNDDANFATTVTTNLSQKLGATATVTLTGDITASATAFSANAVSLTTVDTNLANTNAYIATKTDDTVALATNTALRTLISDRMQVANTTLLVNDRMQVANVISYTAKYLEVANSASVQGEVSNSYLTSTFVTNTVFQSALANTNAYIATKTDDTVALATNTALRTLIDDRMQVANTTLLVNDRMQVANVNTLVNDRIQVANATLLINDRLQVANADSKYATWSSLTSTNTAIRAYVDTEVAALVNSAPTTLNTLDELAQALGDDANFATTVTTNLGQKLGATASITLTGDVTGSGSFSSNAVSIALTDTNLANTNAYIATKTDDTVALATNTALRTLISDRLQVANAAYVTANTISVKNPANYHLYTVTVDTKTSAHPYTGSGSSSAYFLDGVESPSIILAPNQTYRFDQSDSTNSSHPLDFYIDAAKNTSYSTGVTVSGTAGSSGAYTEIVVDEDTPQVLYYQCQSHGYMGSVASILSDTSPKYMEVANTTSFITSTSLSPYLEVANSTSFITSTALTPYLEVANSTSFITSTSLTPYLEVANVATELADYWPAANVIAYTAKYLEVANNTGSGAANTSTTSATLSGTTATFTRADSSTFTLDLSSLSTGGGASVTVSTTAPSSPSEGDQWFDSEDAIMYIYYDSHWVEVQASQQSLTPYEVDVATFTANGTATAFTHTSDTVAAKDMIVTVDGIIQRPTTDYTVSNKTVTFGTAPTDTSIVAIRVTTGALGGVTDATFQSFVANTNAYIATKGVGDVANSYLTSTYVTNTVFQSALANTNAYIATTAATEQTNLANTNAYIATKLDSANSFSSVTVSGGNTILTTTTGTQLNIVAGNNMIIDANDTTKTLTISSSASGGGGGASTGTAIAMALIFG